MRCEANAFILKFPPICLKSRMDDCAIRPQIQFLSYSKLQSLLRLFLPVAGEGASAAPEKQELLHH